MINGCGIENDVIVDMGMIGVRGDDELILAFGGQTDAQIGAGGGLANSALLIGDGNYISGQGRSPPTRFRISVRNEVRKQL